MKWIDTGICSSGWGRRSDLDIELVRDAADGRRVHGTEWAEAHAYDDVCGEPDSRHQFGYGIVNLARWVCRLLTGSNSRRTSSLFALLRRVQLVTLLGFRLVSNPFESEIPTRLLIR